MAYLVHGMDCLIHRLEHRVLAGPYHHSREILLASHDIGRISPNQGITASGNGLVKLCRQFFMADRRMDLHIDFEKTAYVLHFIHLTSETKNSNLFWMIHFTALRDGPYHVIPGYGQSDGGDLLVFGHCLLGRISPGYNRIILICREVGRILHRHYPDVCVKPLFLRVMGYDMFYLFS